MSAYIDEELVEQLARRPTPIAPIGYTAPAPSNSPPNGMAGSSTTPNHYSPTSSKKYGSNTNEPS